MTPHYLFIFTFIYTYVVQHCVHHACLIYQKIQIFKCLVLQCGILLYRIFLQLYLFFGLVLVRITGI